jgi:precorrin-6B methylase 2
MNDILLTLTPEEMDAALIEGGKKYLALIEAVNEQHKAGEKAIYPNEYHVKAEVICRAQVRKVVEWMKKNNTANYVEKYHGWPMQLDEEHWAALEATGEGK